jgi:predicted PurR-regulated permease PerM
VKLGQWIGLVALVVSLYILWEIRQVLLVVFAAILLANSLNLLAQKLRQLGVKSRPLSGLLAVVLFFATMVGFAWLIGQPLAQQFRLLVNLLQDQFNAEHIDPWLNNLRTQLPEQFRADIPDFNSLIQQVQPYVNRLLGGSLALVSGSLGVILNVLLVLILALMLMVNPKAYRRAAVRLFPAFYRRRVDSILQECGIALERWIVGALISMSVVAVLSSLGLSLLGIKAALALGVLAGLLNFIPNIGPTLSVVLPMAIALPDGFKSLMVLPLYFLIQQFESNVLTPYVMAQQVSLLPAVTLMAQVFFATFFGFLGLALAIPLTVVSQIWVRRALAEDVMDNWSKAPLRPLTSGPVSVNNTIYSETVLVSNSEVSSEMTVPLEAGELDSSKQNPPQTPSQPTSPPDSQDR